MAGAVQDTVAWVLPAVAVTALTGPGAAAAVIVFVVAAGDGPTALLATIVNEYVAPPVKPVTTCEVAVAGRSQLFTTVDAAEFRQGVGGDRAATVRRRGPGHGCLPAAGPTAAAGEAGRRGRSR